MGLSTQSYKGARDFYPEDMRLQNYIFDKWREVCIRFGYEEYLTPLLEPTDVYLAKGNEEIVREQTYTFTDRGGRSVTIRPEMTPSVSRIVAARRQELGYPLRLFSICNYMRYERMQRGRLREFWQLNADVFGIEGIAAEHEVITMADQIIQSFGAKRTMYEIRINSRKFINYMLSEYFGFSDVETLTLVRLIDRIDKMSKAEFVALAETAISPKHREAGNVAKLMEILDCKNPAQLPVDLSSHESLNDLAELMVMLEQDGITNARFDIKLMRGFDYYTDIVFEAFDLHPDNNRAMFGGGRYDGLVGQFGVDPVPTFGFAPGDAGAALFLESHGLLPNFMSETELYIALAGVEYKDVIKLLGELRAEGLNIAVDSGGTRKLGIQFKTAEKKKIRYVSVVGEAELKSRRFKLKDIRSSTEEELSIERLIAKVKDARKKEY
jgi:histidyl-tRNA synthetase